MTTYYPTAKQKNGALTQAREQLSAIRREAQRINGTPTITTAYRVKERELAEIEATPVVGEYFGEERITYRETFATRTACRDLVIIPMLGDYPYDYDHDKLAEELIGEVYWGGSVRYFEIEKTADELADILDSALITETK